MQSFGFGIATALFLALAGTAKADESCYDMSKGEPGVLSGKLLHLTFPGPPNFENIQTGDKPEPTYILQLVSPICISGDEFADAKNKFSTVHLIGENAIWGTMKKLINHNVVVNLKDQRGAETGHHHAPLVAWVTAIKPRR